MRILSFFVGGMIAAACSIAHAAQPAMGDEKKPADFQAIIDQAKERVFPALVFVKPIVEDFESGERKKQQVFGSGVIISPDGLALTNNHVVEKAIQVNCVLFNKEQVAAEVLGRDPDTDLALMRLAVDETMKPLPCAVFGDSDAVTEGDFVMALGSPFGFTRSISLGIISNTQRYLGFEQQYRYNLWIQTDAAINPGNSGGPLVDIHGEIIGINTLGLMGADMGFAIPSNVARDVAARLEKHGHVERTWTGLRLQPLKDFFTNTFTEADRGVVVAAVEENSPAQAAGIIQGDIIESLGEAEVKGTYVEDLPALHWRLADLPMDHATTVVLKRGSEQLTLSLEPEQKGKVEGEDYECRRWNMTVKEINRFKEPSLYFHRKVGVYVQGVRYPGNAAQSGLMRNDIIISIDRKPITGLEEVRAEYERIMGEARDKKILLEVLRGGYPKWIVLDYSRDFNEEE